VLTTVAHRRVRLMPGPAGRRMVAKLHDAIALGEFERVPWANQIL
jgi:hypothetical protein